MIFSGPSLLWAVGEIQVEGVSVDVAAPGRYVLSGTIRNRTEDPREVTFRAQVTAYDKSSPKGDVPVIVIRKDQTIILRPREKRKIEVTLFDEGIPPEGSLRYEPMIRVRRQRLWFY